MKLQRIRQLSLTFLLGLATFPVIGEGAGPGTGTISRHIGWSLYFPVHMPGLELSQPVEGGEDINIEADMVDLAEHANSFFALGFGYSFRGWDRHMWFDFNGWHGGYDMELGDLTVDSEVAPPSIIRDLLDVNIDMQQQIVQAEFGVLLLEDWNRIDLGVISGFRYYDQTIKVFGTIPSWNSDCGLIGCFEAKPFSEEEETNWAEFILGLSASYRWSDNNTLVGSFSLGHEESSRVQIINTLTFKESWFASLGWRRDEFVNDGIEIIESGLYFDIGKRF